LPKNLLFYYEQVHTATISQNYRHLQRLCVAWHANIWQLYRNYAQAMPGFYAAAVAAVAATKIWWHNQLSGEVWVKGKTCSVLAT